MVGHRPKRVPAQRIRDAGYLGAEASGRGLDLLALCAQEMCDGVGQWGKV